MKSYAEIYDMAVARKGADHIAAHLPPVPDPPLAELGDDRILSAFSRKIFQAGFNWSVVDAKWPDFEQAFHGFDIARNTMMSDDDIDAHLQNTGIIRHAAKIQSIRDNAIFLNDLAREHGSAAAFFATWPVTDTLGLFDVLKKRGTRLGGMTGQYGLRVIGYDALILSKSVVAALNMAGVIDGAATSKAAKAAVQAAFDGWAEQSGERYAVISRVLGFAVPD